jgi:3-methyladenine DNA glycosylase Tag
VVWFLVLDTARGRACIDDAARASIEGILHGPAWIPGVAVLDCCVLASGVRLLIRAPDQRAVRAFARRFIARVAAAHTSSGLRWRTRQGFAPVPRGQLAGMRTCLEHWRRPAPAQSAVTARSARPRGVKAAIKLAVRYIAAIERANETCLGSDEAAGRIRRYVGAHDPPADDQVAFSRLCEVIFAQGLGFDVVAKHWGDLAKALCLFRPAELARTSREGVARMLAAPGIRNRHKIEACIENARRWIALAGEHTYIGTIAAAAAQDAADEGWPALAHKVATDFVRLREPTARLVLKRWSFFTAKSHPGAQRLLTRLGVIREDVGEPAFQRFVWAVANASAKDPYAVEASLALFAGLGPCRSDPRCPTCPLVTRCPHGRSLAA